MARVTLVVTMPEELTNRTLSEEHVRTIRAELKQMLDSKAFSGSHRCQEFLKFVVEHALEGRTDQLKERNIGSALFGRAVDYETSSDPIVRVKANDVRRRLIRYNLETAGQQPVAIHLPPGSYIPEFEWPKSEEPASEEPEQSTADDVVAPKPAAAGLLRFAWWYRWAAAVILVGMVAGFLLSRSYGGSELDRFWSPALKTEGPVMICFGRVVWTWLSEPAQRQIEEHPDHVSLQPGDYYRLFDSMTSAGNIRAAFSVARLVNRMGKSTEVLWASEARESDLRDRTLVLIGAFNNPWALDLNKDVRFEFVHESDSQGRTQWVVRDRKVAGRKWTNAATWPQPIQRDFAIITRLIDRPRGRVVISVGGMNQFGTQIAGEYLCDRVFWRELTASSPKHWEQKNLQVVLEMEIVGNKAVRPHVVDSYFW